MGAVRKLNNNEGTQAQLVVIGSTHSALTACIGKPFNSTSTPKLKRSLCVKWLLYVTARFDRQMAHKEAHNERLLFCFEENNMSVTAV